MPAKYLSVGLFILFTSLCLAIPAEAIGLSGAKLGTIVLEPGKKIINHYSIIDAVGEPVISLSAGVLSDYIRVTGLDNNEFDLIIEFPGDMAVPAGTYAVSLGAQDGTDEDAEGISALTSVSKRFMVEVYSYEKDITASLTSPDVNEGDPVEFTIHVQSRTYTDIDSVSADITVYDWQDHQIGAARALPKPLKALGEETLTASFEAAHLDPGNYWANAVVTYDGKTMILNDSFKIGVMDIILKNYTTELNRGFTDFRIIVENNWGNLIKDVYAKLFIDSQEYLHTPSINLEPWQISEVKGIVNVDLEPGMYPAMLKIFFSGEEKEEPIFLEITDNPTPEDILVQQQLQKKDMAIIILGIILAVGVGVIIAAALFFLKRRRMT